MRGRVDKVVYHRPSQFPNAVAKIMESGAFRIVFRDQRRLVQKSGSKDVQVHFPDGRKEDVLDLDTLGRFNEVRNFLCNVESIWESQIGRFPLSFSLSKEPSIPSPRNTCSEVRLPLAMRNSQTQNKDGEVCSVESPDGRYLRVSSVSKSRLIYRSHNGAAEQRFHVKDETYPKGARELYDCLQIEIKRREIII
ncbi:hypothetical protein Q1695_012200 [Nippostrongylus brasiliensis]|nr:hypothetical protein Q1695_012200 [Nippostrongylus brasiliensis]